MRMKNGDSHRFHRDRRLSPSREVRGQAKISPPSGAKIMAARIDM
jgi:hypothetical protein